MTELNSLAKPQCNADEQIANVTSVEKFKQLPDQTVSSNSGFPKLIPSLVLVFGLLAMSSTAIFNKISISEISSEATVFNRLLLSTLIFTSWHWGGQWWQSQRQSQGQSLDQVSAPGVPEADSVDGISQKTWFPIGLLFAMAATQLAARLVWTWSLGYTTAANGTMLANMPPIFTAMGGWLFLGQRFDRRFLTGLAIAMGGAVVLALGDWLQPEEELFGRMALIGDAAALLSSAFYAAGFLSVEKLRQRLSTSDILVWRCVLGLAMVAPLVSLLDETIFPISTTGWLAILGLSVVSEVIGHGSVVYVLKHFSSAFVTITFLLEPLPVAAYAWLILGEFLSLSNWLGFILVTVGIYLAKTGQGSDTNHDAPYDASNHFEEKLVEVENI